MINNLPEYVKLKNAYDPAHYPANKKISAEEWNALWLSVIYQGNHQEDILASILNTTIPENIANINNLINITDSHTSLLAGLRSDVDSNSSRIGSLESFTIDLEEAVNNLDSITANHEGRINILEDTDISHNNRISSLEDTVDEWAYTSGLVFTWDTDHYIIGDGTVTHGNGYPTGSETNIIIPKYYDDGTHGIALVTKIGQYAFYDKPFISVKLPETIEEIGALAFWSCNAMKEINLPNNINNIGDQAFSSCYFLRGFTTLPNKLTILNRSLFRECYYLGNNIDIPYGVTTIKDMVFYFVGFIENITIPASVTTLGSNIFHGCSSLKGVTFLGLTPPTIGSSNFIGSSSRIYVPYESLTAYKTATGWSTYASRIYPIPDGKDLTDRLDLKLDTSLKGVNNGLAELDATGKVPSSQLPSYVDDVIEVANYASLPMIGESDKIYITLDTNLTYRWGGSVYVEISPSLALGETSSTAYRGDKGKTAYDHSQLTSGNPHNVTKTNVGLSNAYNPTAYGGISYGGHDGESGISFTDLDSLTYSGFYTCFGTTANVPSGSYSWFIQHINSNVGTATATQIAFAYGTTTIIYKRNKTNSIWGAWGNMSPSLKENVINKVTSISSSSTDMQYPTAKCMYDIIGNIETLLAEV